MALDLLIVEEHFGTIGFEDREGGGTVVRISLDTAKLAPLAGGGDDDTSGEESRPELTRKTG
jgi:two-component system, NtrC family, nitrogen regulation sensor histidine kinase NtrY